MAITSSVHPNIRFSDSVFTINKKIITRALENVDVPGRPARHNKKRMGLLPQHTFGQWGVFLMKMLLIAILERTDHDEYGAHVFCPYIGRTKIALVGGEECFTILTALL